MCPKMVCCKRRNKNVSASLLESANKAGQSGIVGCGADEDAWLMMLVPTEKLVVGAAMECRRTLVQYMAALGALWFGGGCCCCCCCCRWEGASSDDEGCKRWCGA